MGIEVLTASIPPPLEHLLAQLVGLWGVDSALVSSKTKQRDSHSIPSFSVLFSFQRRLAGSQTAM